MEKSSSGRKKVLVAALVLVLIGIVVVSVLLVMSLNEDNRSAQVGMPQAYNAANSAAGQGTSPTRTSGDPTEPVYSKPVPTTESAAAPTTEPTAAPTAKPTVPQDADEGYVSFTGKPAMGATLGKSYINSSVRLSFVLPEGMEFQSEKEILELNVVNNANELLALDGPVVAFSEDRAVLIAFYKLGSDVVDGCTTVADALEYCADTDVAFYEDEYDATVEEFSNVYVTFSAGNVQGYLADLAWDNNSVTFLHLGYRVGDYMVFMSIYGDDLDAIENILTDVDVR